MIFPFKEFLKKYGLEDLENSLVLDPSIKIEFLKDLNKIMKIINKIFDKLTNISSLRGGQILMALAKLETLEEVINKADIMRSLNIDRREKLYHAFDYLKEQNYIEIIEKSPKFHIIKLNIDNNPDLLLFKEIVGKYWRSPEENKLKVNKWRK
ncbi:MAG: hypothetical protein JXA99_03590 [Candidatus Lokiarchaeota archaeon]|nr:hypothetical protein [Candidatus Lokiarchaeota archaeon]